MPKGKEDYSKLNIYQKISRIRKNMEVFKKDSEGYGYMYVSEETILSKLSVWLDKMGLLLVPSIVSDSCWATEAEVNTVKQDKKTKEMINETKTEVLVKGEMHFTWINIDNPEERLEVPWYFVGQQADASQAFGSGLTYSNRYFLLKFFNIATVEDDPDNWRSKQKFAEKEEDIMLARGIIAQVDEFAKNYAAKAKDTDKAKAEILKIVKKYVKSGDYRKIEEPVLATSLLEELKGLTEKKKEAK